MPENEISTEIWEKYKALAAGTAAQKEPNAKTLPESPSQSSETQPEAAQEAPAKTGGFSNILQTYQQNKQQRSQLRSLQFNTGKPAEEDKGP